LQRPLFLRLPRGVRPTPLADQLAREVTQPLDTLSATAGNFRPNAELTKATLLLGGPADVLAEVVLPALAPLIANGLSVRVRTGLTAELMTALGDGELDVVVATTPTRTRGVTLVPYFDEVLALMGSPRLALQTGARIGSSAAIPSKTIAATNWPLLLEDFALIAFAENAPLVRRYWRLVFGLSSAPAPRVVFNDLRAVAKAVASGTAWTVLPTYLARAQLDLGELTILHTPPQSPTNTLYLATRSLRSTTSATSTLKRIVEFLLQSVPQ
jgi:DNA-binding transcriptional LysR family regulator